MKEDIKTKTTLWLYPATMSRMDSWLHADNCKSRSEFVEKALHFYMGYLATEDVSEYLSKALVATLRGVLADNANRLVWIDAFDTSGVFVSEPPAAVGEWALY